MAFGEATLGLLGLAGYRCVSLSGRSDIRSSEAASKGQSSSRMCASLIARCERGFPKVFLRSLKLVSRRDAVEV
jgi:hypothetical protein